jgi:hypothetical protein
MVNDCVYLFNSIVFNIYYSLSYFPDTTTINLANYKRQEFEGNNDE